MENYGRLFNFSAGPSMLPVPVLERCAAEMLNYKGTGTSVMEMSHRSKAFEEIAAEAQQLFTQVLCIPKNYRVLFMQGGATLQFAALPLNLKRNGSADYVKSGNFSTLAANEAKKFIDVQIAGSTESLSYSRVPLQEELTLNPDADYLHICMNNTIYGTCYPYIPNAGAVPVVADISSSILSAPLDVSAFGMLYAGVQKNIAPAGMAVVIIREDLLQEPDAATPAMLNYKLAAENQSMYNTPNCWSIYITKLVLEYIVSIGGLTAMEQHNQKKAALLYNFLENSRLFYNPVHSDCRSMMNVIFTTQNPALDAKFIAQATERGMTNLKGHKVLGGMRASIYNNMPYAGLEALVGFMEQFEAQNQ